MAKTILISVVLLAGCGTLRITDDEVERIAQATGATTQAVTRNLLAPVVDPYAPGGAAAGGAAAGFLIMYATRAILKALQQKKKDDLLVQIQEAVHLKEPS